MKDKQREAFEDFFSKSPFEWPFDRYKNGESWEGQYRAYEVQCAWEGWQASRKFNLRQNEKTTRMLEAAEKAAADGQKVVVIFRTAQEVRLHSKNHPTLNIIEENSIWRLRGLPRNTRVFVDHCVYHDDEFFDDFKYNDMMSILNRFNQEGDGK